MKQLWLTQPWASLWALGADLGGKGIETRGWGTSYRGQVAVGATKELLPDLATKVRQPFFVEAMARLGYQGELSLPRGCIVGVVTLTDVLVMVEGPYTPITEKAGMFALGIGNPRLTHRERAFGDYRPGRRAWITEGERHIFREPIPARGSQGLRDVPPELEARLTASRGTALTTKGEKTMRNSIVVLGLVAALLGGACQKSGSTDLDARAFAAKMGGKVTEVSCVDYDTDGDGYVSCTIFREGQDPFSIECASGWGFNGGCKVPKLRANGQ